VHCEPCVNCLGLFVARAGSTVLTAVHGARVDMCWLKACQFWRRQRLALPPTRQGWSRNCARQPRQYTYLSQCTGHRVLTYTQLIGSSAVWAWECVVSGQRVCVCVCVCAGVCAAEQGVDGAAGAAEWTWRWDQWIESGTKQHQGQSVSQSVNHFLHTCARRHAEYIVTACVSLLECRSSKLLWVIGVNQSLSVHVTTAVQRDLDTQSATSRLYFAFCVGCEMSSSVWSAVQSISAMRAGYLWSPYVIGQTIIFSSCFFFFLSFFSLA